MDNSKFHKDKEQAEKFRDFSKKFPERDLLSLFEKWAESKDFSDDDKQGIWKIVRCLAS